MPTKPLSVAEAKAVVNRLEEQRSDLVTQQTALTEALASAREAAGAQFLESGDAVAVARKLSQSEAEITVIGGAITVLDARLQAAETDLKRATAASLRGQAGTKRAELDALNTRTAPLLAKLSELEDVPYTTSILASQRTGIWFPAVPVGEGGLADSWLGCAEVVPDPVSSSYAVPKSRQLRAEADALDREAEILERELHG